MGLQVNYESTPTLSHSAPRCIEPSFALQDQKKECFCFGLFGLFSFFTVAPAALTSGSMDLYQYTPGVVEVEMIFESNSLIASKNGLFGSGVYLSEHSPFTTPWADVLTSNFGENVLMDYPKGIDNVQQVCIELSLPQSCVEEKTKGKQSMYLHQGDLRDAGDSIQAIHVCTSENGVSYWFRMLKDACSKWPVSQRQKKIISASYFCQETQKWRMVQQSTLTIEPSAKTDPWCAMF